MSGIERRQPLPGLAFEGRARRLRSQGRRLLLWILPWFFWLPAASAEFPPGPFTQAQCLECHGERDPILVDQWRSGPHADRADCLGCHGDRHGALPTARADSACTACHSGAVAHSYSTSKHGVLVRLGQPDWSRPLRRGEYRAPGCAYCHLHDGDHGDTMAAGRERTLREWVCSACHAPRYVAEQFAAGERLLAIARLKAQEAEEIAARHPRGATAVESELKSVAGHLRHVRLGAGHQSPDYQWWHGQPALDGDLIRLREAVARATREAALAARSPVAPAVIPPPEVAAIGVVGPRR